MGAPVGVSVGLLYYLQSSDRWVAILIRNDIQRQVSFTNLTFTEPIGVDFWDSHRPGRGPNGPLLRNR